MSDETKKVSEAKGPYAFTSKSMWDYPTISGPGTNGDKIIIGTLEWVKMVNFAYAEGRKSRDGLRRALISISRNTCCGTCQEAKLVALAALEADGEEK